MKLVHKIVLGNVLGIITIALVAAFSYHEFVRLQAKLRFVEISDNLNSCFLEMRLSEKNYFLYHDPAALAVLRDRLEQSRRLIERMRRNIVLAVGEEDYRRLNVMLDRYETEILQIGTAGHSDQMQEARIREAGQELRVFSKRIIDMEKEQVNRIISSSIKVLFYFFSMVLLVAITSTYLFFSKMFRSLRRIEKVANSISSGNFKKIEEEEMPDNELGSVMRAINSMCEELETRHEQLIQAKKLSSLGILTAGVAHELGNPLNNICMVAQTYLALSDKLGEETRREYMETVLSECDRIKNIVQSLLDFSRAKETEFKVSDMNGVISKSIKLVQNMLHVADIDTRLELQEGLPPVLMDENKIQSVLVNLVTNAIQAMPSGGTLTVRTSFREGEDHMTIEVEDTGKGIPEEFLPHIFDPFFSTKGTKGTGLGLSISYGIIKNHDGRIHVRSKVGEGTTFTIELPVHATGERMDEATQNHGDRR